MRECTRATSRVEVEGKARPGAAAEARAWDRAAAGGDGGEGGGRGARRRRGTLLVAGMLAAALLPVACGRTRTPAMGRVAWVQGDSLLVRSLPDGPQRVLLRARRIRSPRWSATGEWLAVRAADAIRLVRGDGGGSQVLARSDAGELAWSPVDDRIAYVAGGNLIVARAGGIGVVLFERTAAGAAEEVTWSHDGAAIAFAVRPGGPAAAAPPATPPGGGRVLVIPARGGPTRALPTPAASGVGVPLLEGWTADGAGLLVLVDSDGTRSGAIAGTGAPLFLLATTQAGPSPATAPVLLADSVLPYRDFVATAPAGGSVALVAGGGAATWRNKAVVVASAGGRQRLSAPDRAAITPAWSPDARHLAWAQMPDVRLAGGIDADVSLNDRRIVVAELPSAGRSPTPAQPLTAMQGRQESPHWLADGRHIVYVGIEEDGTAWLWLAAPGEAPRRVAGPLAEPDGGSGRTEFGFTAWNDVFDVR